MWTDMSTVIRSCPGCKSLILSDTDQCPECGHVFYQRRKSEPTVVSAPSSDSMKSASIHEPCPHCGEMVRTGLVRCWSCNGFMRADVAARYKDMTSNPQKIIYSTIPIDQRTDFLPARADNTPAGSNVFDADEFTLSEDLSASSTAHRVENNAPSGVDRTVSPPTSVNDGPDKPQTTTPAERGSASKTAASTEVDSVAATSESAGSDGKTSSSKRRANQDNSTAADPDDLLSIAMAEQREVKKRRGEKIAERQRKQMLVPCSCGAWIRVSEDQSGKVVRCRQCKQPVTIPEIRKRTEKKDEKPAVPSLDITWVNDVWFHALTPTSLVLKPGRGSAYRDLWWRKAEEVVVWWWRLERQSGCTAEGRARPYCCFWGRQEPSRFRSAYA